MLCHECRKPYSPNEAQRREFQLEQFASDNEVTLYHPTGCETCAGTGYLGRIAIVEMLVMSEAIRELVLQHASAGKIERKAREEGHAFDV